MATYATSLSTYPAGSPAGAAAVSRLHPSTAPLMLMSLPQAFGYFEMVAFAALGTWVLVATFFLKWCVGGKYVQAHSRISEHGGDDGDDKR